MKKDWNILLLATFLLALRLYVDGFCLPNLSTTKSRGRINANAWKKKRTPIKICICQFPIHTLCIPFVLHYLIIFHWLLKYNISRTHKSPWKVLYGWEKNILLWESLHPCPFFFFFFLLLFFFFLNKTSSKRKGSKVAFLNCNFFFITLINLWIFILKFFINTTYEKRQKPQSTCFWIYIFLSTLEESRAGKGC